mmetsp:Transcript_23399/g.39098  ORF Transcript_23399/g.39098 Transcript_23399/m.39098 type:complete len:302 (-) Transcript_23399:3295-4200(-)
MLAQAMVQDVRHGVRRDHGLLVQVDDPVLRARRRVLNGVLQSAGLELRKGRRVVVGGHQELNHGHLGALLEVELVVRGHLQLPVLAGQAAHERLAHRLHVVQHQVGVVAARHDAEVELDVVPALQLLCDAGHRPHIPRRPHQLSDEVEDGVGHAQEDEPLERGDDHAGQSVHVRHPVPVRPVHLPPHEEGREQRHQRIVQPDHHDGAQAAELILLPLPRLEALGYMGGPPRHCALRLVLIQHHRGLLRGVRRRRPVVKPRDKQIGERARPGPHGVVGEECGEGDDKRAVAHGGCLLVEVAR